MAMIKIKNPVFLLLYFNSLLYLVHAANNTISKGQLIPDGQPIFSENNNFAMGFFGPENSSLRYVGIWYNRIQDRSVIWVANRQAPLRDRNGVLTVGNNGNLIVRDGNGAVVWSSNVLELSSNNTQANLEDTGNVLLSEADDIQRVYWKSFDHPTDTFLPSMRVLATATSGENKAFVSWKSATDPSPGNYTMGVDPRAAPQIVIWEGDRRRWRSGYWDGTIFTGVTYMSGLTNFVYGFKTEFDNGEVYITYNPLNDSDFMKFQISWDGFEKQLQWNESEKQWDSIQQQPANDCELYNFCGDFAICSESSRPRCRCMEGFHPVNGDQWNMDIWSGGCMRNNPLQCQRNDSSGGAEDRFKEMSCNKLPDFADLIDRRQISGSCEEICLRNCSCKGYADVDNIGCMIWYENLIDIQDFGKPGIVMHLRLADSEFDESKLSRTVIALIAVGGAVFLALLAGLLWFLKRKFQARPAAASASLNTKSEVPFSDMSKSKGYSSEISGPADLVIEGSQVNGPDLPLFSFSYVAAATDNFSEELGQGGFGHVYKGKLPTGEDIAVKRLSKISGQGLEEFKNEIILIAKLQHRNLVRLLGCCIHGEEKLLLYEYMPNKSLDFILFDPAKQAILDWKTRFAIIEGIARGLLYLHRDSRLRIIHRDLKASNILLDEEMTPKISDFGMARIFGGNQNELNTNRVVGTYGYMSPEYAMEGLFSVKSDVYSFGVLLLEIISGRRNTSFRQSDHASLIAYAWDLWNEDKAIDLLDPSIRESCNRNEVLRCINVGMLCVQDSAVQRPTMSHVVLMLESNNTSQNLPLPRQPTYTSMRASIDTSEIYLDGQEIQEFPSKALTWG
ncbi:G-type lectin S-receptor-like serine/threonine-protein kinase B120 isoform X2 [Mercurialis annua]|uniref:G-type lectin S-receptor-like serine/threonine-protein kinase B120 isoform X2 n=1 Tax=Mercurialis annua TaxID=3986 RepID=UPI00215EE9B1|nr:G-type lectin S-receptor-like serine/threonine-protein kinase B120 isoform X2 [Mercurialis annua]